jgi:hypothetical protein
MTRHPTPAQARVRAHVLGLMQQRGSGERLDVGLLRGVLAAARQALGEDDPVTLEAEFRVLEAEAPLGRTADAAAAFESFYGRCFPLLGASDVLTRSAASQRAQWVRKSGDVDRGIRLYEQELRLREKTFGAGAYRTCVSRSNLAVALRERGTPADVRRSGELLDEDVPLRVAGFGTDHAFTWAARMNQVYLWLHQAERVDMSARTALAEAARDVAQEIAGRRAARLGPRNVSTLRSHRAHARALLLLHEHERAVWLLWKVLTAEHATRRVEAGRTEFYLAAALAGTGRVEDRIAAERMAAKAEALTAERLYPGAPEVRGTRALLDAVRRTEGPLRDAPLLRAVEVA